MGKKKPMKMNPHPYDEDAEKAMKVIYGIEMRSQMITLRRILSDFAEDGFTQEEVMDAVDEFARDDDKPSNSLMLFRAYARTHIRRKRNARLKVNALW